MKRDEARTIAETLCDLLRPACEQIVIAGSIRRAKAECRDIEIVVLPTARLNLFGEPGGNFLAAEIEAAMAREVHLGWDRQMPRRGERYKRFWWAGWNPSAGIAVDLFIADAHNFGNTLAIRTGDADFSRLLVTRRLHGGLMPSDMRQRDGYLWRVAGFANPANCPADERLSCPDESAFFAALGVADVPEPRARDAACIDRLRKQMTIVGAP